MRSENDASKVNENIVSLKFHVHCKLHDVMHPFLFNVCNIDGTTDALSLGYYYTH